MATPPLPPKTFRAECPKCDKVAEHEEFFRERRSIGSAQAAQRGDFKTMHEYSFRCKACGQRNEKLVDEQGVLHKWQGNRHTMMKV
ncbi:MAG TPA: hypothetical protein VFH78_11600 [Candidatus Thermoplasmatota archaeon]|nr:hypothetical protein [Candidatus Thermoplasmatota archaeon]